MSTIELTKEEQLERDTPKVFLDESTGIEYSTLKDLQDKRMVKTNDAKGFAYTDGNRATRRGIYKQLRTGNGHQTPKQFHKQGHK